MPDLIQFLNQGWVGTLVGGIGIGLAIFFYWRSRIEGILALQHDGFRIVGGEHAVFPDDITIQFRGRPVPRVTVSRLFVWNAGKKTVRGADVVEADPLRIELPVNGRLLSVSVPALTRPVTSFRAVGAPDSTEIQLQFDFLDPGDGAVIEAIHTGPVNRPKLLGTVRGMPHGIKDWGRGSSFFSRAPRPFPSSAKPRVVFSLAVLIGLSMAFIGLFRPDLAQSFPSLFDSPAPDRQWWLVGVGVVYAVPPLVVLWRFRRRYPSALDPDSWEGAEDDSET
jgi:hypothetical protein